MAVDCGIAETMRTDVAPEEANIVSGHVLSVRLLSLIQSSKPPKGGAALPMELISIIGEFLAGSHSRKSLAAFSVVNHLIHGEVLPILYETLVWVSQITQSLRCWAHLVCVHRIPHALAGYSLKGILRVVCSIQSKSSRCGSGWRLTVCPTDIS
jgi:hypothetical protein